MKLIPQSFRSLMLLMGLSGSIVLAQDYSALQYQEVARKSVYFYGAQRSGDVPNWLTEQHSGSSISFPNDGITVGRDLSGGWHDAGDFIKFSLTIGSSSYGVLKAYDGFPSAFKDEDSFDYSGTPDGIPDILNEAKAATDYLLKIYLSSDSVVSRIGGDQDHNSWTTSPIMSTRSTANGGDPRPVYFGTKADIAGIATASMALMSRLYRAYDSAYADSLYDMAVLMYDYAEANPGITPEPGDNYYLDSDDTDDLLCGAIELYLADSNAVGASAYKTKAISYNTQLGVHGWVVDWANSADYCRHSMALAGLTQGNAAWKNAVDSYVNRVSSDQYVDGLMYLGVDWGTARYAMHAAFSASLYYQQFGGDQYRVFAISQLDYMMGSNEYNRSLIVGYGENAPTKPHHKNSYGRDVPSWNLNQEPLFTLTGALVGGPSVGNASGGTTPGYADVITDYVSNEVSIDYNVGLVGTSGFAASLESTVLLSLPKTSHQEVKFQFDGNILSLNPQASQSTQLLGSQVDLVRSNGQIMRRLIIDSDRNTTWDLSSLPSGSYRVVWGTNSYTFTRP